MVAYCEEFPSSGDGLWRAALSRIKALNFGQEAGFQKLVVEFTDTQLWAFLMSREDCLTKLHELLIYIRDIQSAFCELFF